MWRYHRIMHWLKYSNPWIQFKKYIRYNTFDDVEVWNLSDHTAMFILPRLKALRASHCGYPAHLGDTQTADAANLQWEQILDDIIYALELQLQEDRPYVGEEADKNRISMEKGYKLMGEYWLSLWD